MGISFTELGIDPVRGAELVALLDFDVHELQMARQYNKLKDVFQYLNNAKDVRMIVTRVTAGKDNKLEHLHNYIMVRKEYDETVKQFIEAEISAKETTQSPEELMQRQMIVSEIGQKVQTYKNELAIYEK